jgi:hypothetical protein
VEKVLEIMLEQVMRLVQISKLLEAVALAVQVQQPHLQMQEMVALVKRIQ